MIEHLPKVHEDLSLQKNKKQKKKKEKKKRANV